MKQPILFDQALALIRDCGGKRNPQFAIKTERVPLAFACGRISARPIRAAEAVPAFDNSSMDGFAVRADETRGASESTPVCFSVVGRILAGDAPLPDRKPLRDRKIELRQPKPGSSYEIMTGAPMPAAADAVYKIEDVEVAGAFGDPHRQIRVKFPLQKFENLRRAAADFRVGQNILDAGTRLMPEQIMALAAVGVDQIEVWQTPKIAFLSTGSELVAHDEKNPSPGKVRNTTAPYLCAAIPCFGAQVRAYGCVEDNREKFASTILAILADAPDLIITTGAVSKGSHDFIPAVMKDLGAEAVFHNVLIRPGKPQLLAQFAENGPVFFGLPGNPVSGAVGLRFFINAYLRALTGQGPERPMVGQLATAVSKPRGLRCLYKAAVKIGVQGAVVTILEGQSSFMISSLLPANAWAVLPESGEELAAGTKVEFYPLYPLNYQYGAPTAEGLDLKVATHRATEPMKGTQSTGSPSCC